MVVLGEAATAVSPAVVDVLDLDEALEALALLDPRLCRVVELKYFVGFTIDETAAALDVSPATVERDWTRRQSMAAWPPHGPACA